MRVYIAVIAFFLVGFSGNVTEAEPVKITDKVNGLSFVGTTAPIGPANIKPMVDVRANYVTFIPFSYGKFGSSNLVYKDISWQWWGERREGIEASCRLAQEQGLKVMIKPQVWFDFGEFTGHFELSSDVAWQAFEKDYRAYIMEYAEVSEKYGLEMFCIGTELCKFVEQRPEFWQQLIKDVRRVYSGKLTYAANWDSYPRAGFWKQLDYIGVDAYFPISDSKTPGLNDLVKGWKPVEQKLKSFSEKNGAAILFTEWGYRSTDYCAYEPWDYSKQSPYNPKAQANAYKAVFEALWEEDWFAGGFLWKWYPNHNKAGGEYNVKFTPQNKPAEQMIKEYFEKYSN